MARGLKRRLRRLEGGTGARCPECGYDGDPSKLEYVLEWVDEVDRGNEYCGTCGRATHMWS